ncbi:hypothetical protein [Ornithinimicrobium pekingense]|uniref:Asparagine synthase n=1 Tax=Ornithinimicrobium pekingense TaxID=384677 RepID=A0ABQ2F910_9MICO|nr:hypothetical protein [Ornithinimicrobium pekingense]GGK73585.1 hypothetical protein GCM10011509_22740 [Ornithinimicrobium pekingense]
MSQQPPGVAPLSCVRHDAAGEVDEGLVLDGAHGHGYLLLSAGVPAPAAVHGWRRVDGALPGLHLFLHPRTVLSRAATDRGTVVLLGHPVDVAAGTADGDRIAATLAAAWAGPGAEAMVREAAYLGGRWTLLARRTGKDGEAPDLLVVPDTHATQPVFHATSGGRLALGSAPSLPAEALGLPVDEGEVALREELRRRRPGAVTYLPGRLTGYRGVDPLVPNCLLRVDLDPVRVEHRRFWPWQEHAETEDVDAVYERFRARIGAHVELLAGLGRPAVSLTAGGDSRVTAAVAHRVVRDGGGLAFTYVNPRDARRSAAAMADVTGASAVAAQLGLPHRVLRWRQAPPDGTFATLHRRTFAPLPGSHGAAFAMWSDLPGDLVQLQSNCAETGTAFLRHRTDEPLDPLRLARMMMHATEGLEDLAGAMYGDYPDYAQMTPARMLGHDHHDLFYWEQRIGRWGWQKFADGDLGHRVLLPFNDRALVETMLSLPYPLRESKLLLRRILEEEPAARLPVVPSTLGSRLSTRLRRLPGPVRRRVVPRVRRATERPGVARATFPGGYAVLPSDGAGVTVPRGWARLALPEGVLGRASGVELRHHRRLAHALAGDAEGWVLVLGEPVLVGAGLVGARPVADALARTLAGPGAATPRGRGEVLDSVVLRAACLAGRYLVLAGDVHRTVAVPDPLTALGVQLLDGGGGRPGGGTGAGLVSHPLLATGRTRPVGPDQLVVVSRRGGGAGMGVRPLGSTVDLRSVVLDRHPEEAVTRDGRLARHAQVLAGRGTPWLGLTSGPASAGLLPHVAAAGGSALTWWDRAAGDAAAHEVFAASALARGAGVPHRVVGLREDVDGRDTEPGRTARAVAARGLAATWGPGADDTLPVSAAVARALPGDAVVWFGSRPGEDGLTALAARPWELLQDARPCALPWSDRLLDLLPPGGWRHGPGGHPSGGTAGA